MFLEELCDVEGERKAGGRLFQARKPAMANARSPIVERCVDMFVQRQRPVLKPTVRFHTAFKPMQTKHRHSVFFGQELVQCGLNKLCISHCDETMAIFSTCDVSGYDVTDMMLFSHASYN